MEKVVEVTDICINGIMDDGTSFVVKYCVAPNSPIHIAREFASPQYTILEPEYTYIRFIAGKREEEYIPSEIDEISPDDLINLITGE